jgi:hypothetical protein
MKIPKRIMEDLEDQANQILYFESAMSDEDEAFKSITKRLVHVYQAGVEMTYQCIVRHTML